MTVESATVARPPRRLGRSVGAVALGLVVVVVLSTATDVAMRALGIFPPSSESMTDGGLFALATTYRVVYQVLGSYIAARLAPYAPMLHALILGGIGLLLAALGAIATSGKPEMGPVWYPIALVVSALPCAWLGGVLYRLVRG